MKIALAAAAALLFASGAQAQGSLSTQGFGYPPGQLSTRVESMGGAGAELDHLSALNPASIMDMGSASLYLQYDPEFRTVSTATASSSTTTARFPLVNLIYPLSSRWNFGLGSSTLLDRSAETRTTRQRFVNGDTVIVNDRVRTLGAIDDIRVALGYAPSSTFRFGGAVHVLTGVNQITSLETFPDSAIFSNVSQTSRLSYSGVAASAGMEIHPSKAWALGLSGRKGGNIRAESGDTVLGTAKVPDHYGATLQYSGWGEANLGVHVARDAWTSMQSLTSSSVTAYDAWDVGAGAEAVGPRFLTRPTLLRLGVRHRTLPFSTTGSSVSELSIGGGVGLELSPNRASLDIGLQHATRSSGSAISEHAYLLSFGLRVVP